MRAVIGNGNGVTDRSRQWLSLRHFARLFRSEVGATPAVWVEQVRVNAARGLLETSKVPSKQIAVLCGFSDQDTLRRAFSRQLGITPAEYRKRHADQMT